ncbi:MAG: hypothetical protein IJ291_07300 [Lachnospiraceae bacterium]|nr:hypothetical protein [Lachnospiraceae bacterium]
MQIDNRFLYDYTQISYPSAENVTQMTPEETSLPKVTSGSDAGNEPSASFTKTDSAASQIKASGMFYKKEAFLPRISGAESSFKATPIHLNEKIKSMPEPQALVDVSATNTAANEVSDEAMDAFLRQAFKLFNVKL